MKKLDLNKILTLIILVLLVIIGIGSVFGLVKKSRSEPEKLIAQGKAENLAPPANTDVVAYFDLGQLRVFTASQNDGDGDAFDGAGAATGGVDGSGAGSATGGGSGQGGTLLILDPWLSYPKDDAVFYEELDRKQILLKGIFASYFKSRTKADLLDATETVISEELLQKINAELFLGKVQAIYFTDYLFLE